MTVMTAEVARYLRDEQTRVVPGAFDCAGPRWYYCSAFVRRDVVERWLDHSISEWIAAAQRARFD